MVFHTNKLTYLHTHAVTDFLMFKFLKFWGYGLSYKKINVSIKCSFSASYGYFIGLKFIKVM